MANEVRGERQSIVSTGPGGPLSSPAAIARSLKLDKRLGDANVEVSAQGDAVEIRRDEAIVIAILISGLHPETMARYLDRLALGTAGLVFCGATPTGILEQFPPGAVVALAHEDGSGDSLLSAVHNALERVELRQRAEKRGRWLNRYRYELGELIEISRAITQERDINRLLNLILEKSRFITAADAGSIYVIEGTDHDVRRRKLRFKLSQNDSCSFESKEFTMPVSMRSIAGAAVLTRKPINIPDVYELATDSPFGFDRSFDEKVGYRTRSMIAMPLISAEDEVIGVIQLINKKTDGKKKLEKAEDFANEVQPFDQRAEELLATLASQAGIALENALLYDEIKRIFEGFVRASVQAIEQRDPTTSGHSLRVSLLSCALADTVDKVQSGPYADTSFSKRDIKELEYASLLHDFGKIGVREEVLVKAKKLYPHALDAIRARFSYVLKATESDVLGRKVRAMKEGAGAGDLAALDEELARRRNELEEAWRIIREANEPTVLKQGDFGRITEIGALTFTDADGQIRTLLSPDEVVSLQVTKGSLNAGELEEIRSHVVHTYNFLVRIPWGKSFSRVPGIAGAHHERLNGTGYPHRWSAAEIPVQSKIMTIADIFDALTARDRPYKKALPVERALDILGFEVKDGGVDGELVRIFREAEVYKVVEKEHHY